MHSVPFFVFVAFVAFDRKSPRKDLPLEAAGLSDRKQTEISNGEDQNQKRSLGNALSVLSSCLLFGRETHASTTQSDPLLLPTRNGPCRKDGALRLGYPFCRVQPPPP